MPILANWFNYQVFKETPIKGLVSSDYVTKQIFFNSKDGTKVPMFVTHHKVKRSCGIELFNWYYNLGSNYRVALPCGPVWLDLNPLCFVHFNMNTTPTPSQDLVLDGNNPTLMYGYGGFNISLSPSYSSSRMIFIKFLGGVFCEVNMRGGGSVL